MSTESVQLNFEEMRRGAGPYPREAYEFVLEGLNYTSERVHDHACGLDELDCHITGQQLCIGLRDYAIERYGLMAPSVLVHWHVRRTEDFGRMVFAMIDAGCMKRSDEDSFDDFRAVFDFDEAFAEDQLLAAIGTGVAKA